MGKKSKSAKSGESAAPDFVDEAGLQVPAAVLGVTFLLYSPRFLVELQVLA